jgi:protein phosphatase
VAEHTDKVAILEEAFRRAHARLLRDSSARGLDPLMASTLTLAWVMPRTLCVAHAGDSRLYRLQDGRFEQLTTDHTVADRWSNLGLVPGRGQSGTKEWENVLWNAIGGHEEGLDRVECTAHSIKPDDIFLLCTDGLWRERPDREIQRLLDRVVPLSEAVRMLVATGDRRMDRAVIAFQAYR